MKKLRNNKIVIKSEKGLYHINFDNYKKIKEYLLNIRKKAGKKQNE